MPIGAKSLLPQTADNTLGQVTVLETAAGQYNAFLADMPGNSDDGFRKRIVKPRREPAH